MKDTGITLLAASFVVLILILLPFAIIWSWNVLFPMIPIPYTFDTWLAVGVLGIFFNSTSIRGK
jgi:Co/Zn/Cd efflux system component